MDIQGIVPPSYPAQAFEHDLQRTETQQPLTSLSSSLQSLTLPKAKAAAVLRAESIEQGHLGLTCDVDAAGGAAAVLGF